MPVTITRYGLLKERCRCPHQSCGVLAREGLTELVHAAIGASWLAITAADLIKCAASGAAACLSIRAASDDIGTEGGSGPAAAMVYATPRRATLAEIRTEGLTRRAHALAAYAGSAGALLAAGPAITGVGLGIDASTLVEAELQVTAVALSVNAGSVSARLGAASAVL